MKIIIIALLALWATSLGQVPLLDWDEANFAEIAREMVVSGDWSFVRVGFEPFWEKPPLFFWLQAVSFKLLGVSEFAARLPNIIVGALTFLFIAWLGRKRSAGFARVWMMAYACSFLPSFYFRTGLIDPLFNLFIIASLVFWFEFESSKKLTQALVSSLLMACAIMTKGPTALLMMGVVVGLVWVLNFKTKVKVRTALIFLGVLVLSFIPYLVWMRHQGSLNQGKVATDFVSYLFRLFNTADAGHGGFPLYHVVVLAIGCLPLSLFLKSGWKMKDRYSQLMKVLLVTVVVIFSLVQTKIIHYSSLAYFPLTYLGALAIEEKIKRGEFISKKIIGIIGLFFTLLCSLPLFLYSDLFLSLVRDSDLIESIHYYKLSGGWSLIQIVLAPAIIALMSLGYLVSTKKYFFHDRRIIAFLIVCTQVWMMGVVPKFAQIAQGSLIEFYKRARNEKTNIEPLGFKSYARYFYSEYEPSHASAQYAVSRARDSDWAIKNHRLVLVERKAGWVLYRMLR